MVWGGTFWGLAHRNLASLSAQWYPAEELSQIAVIPGDQQLSCDAYGAIGADNDTYKQCQDEVLNSGAAEGIEGEEDEQCGKAGIERPGQGLRDADIDNGAEVGLQMSASVLSNTVEHHDNIIHTIPDHCHHGNDEHGIDLNPEKSENSEHYEDIVY